MDSPGRRERASRRRLLRAVGTSAVAALAGCSGVISREFVAGTVGLSAAGVRELGFGQPTHETLVDQRQVSVAGQDVAVTVRSQVVTYGARSRSRITDWRLADPVTRAVGVVSTPEADVLGREANPMATIPPSQLLHTDQGRALLQRAGVGDGDDLRYVREPERLDARAGVELLDQETTVEAYAGVADGGNDPDEEFLVQLARAIVEGDVVLVFAVQRRLIAGDADGPQLLDGDIEVYDLDLPREILAIISHRITVRPPLVIDFSDVTTGSSGFGHGPALFVPRGFNYIWLREHPDGYLWHDTFNPARYDPAVVQADFDVLAAHEFDLLRVFIDQLPDEGVIERAADTGFSTEYVDNVVDFLRRARDADVFVILTFPGFAPRADHPPTVTRPIEGRNRHYLVRDFIDYKAAYVSDFLRTLLDREPALESTLFAVELENETHVQVDRLPFSERTGTVTTATGDTYDRGSDADLQRMVDENVTLWANTCTAAIREAAPDTLVSANVYPYAARGLDGPGSFDPPGSFTTVPADPLVLTRTDIDYLDLHIYRAAPADPPRELESIDFPAVRRELDDRNKPLLLGEFGAFTYNYRDLDHATTEIEAQWEYLRDQGFHGFAFWPYQDNAQEDMFAATDGPGDGTLLELLADV